MNAKYKKNAFTLLELIGVISLLGILTLIITPAVSGAIRKQKDNALETEKDQILMALRNWAGDNKEILPTDDGLEINVSIEELKQSGYLDYDLRNPKTQKCFSNDNILSVTKNKKLYNYDFVDELVDGENNDCITIGNSPIIYLLGDSILYLNQGEEYTEPGFYARDLDDKDISSDVIITNNIDKTKYGKYYVKYSITYNGITKTKNRTVIIKDTEKPVINAPAVTILDVNTSSFDALDGVIVSDNSNDELEPTVISNVSLGVTGTYYVTYVCTDSAGNTTSFKRKVIISKEKYYVENSLNGADPVLDQTMIPIEIDNNGVAKKADIKTEWYKYDNGINNSKWANAILVSDESRDIYQRALPGYTIKPKDIRAYLVWIPRFKYAIPATTDNVNLNPPLIDIIFENNENSKSKGDATGVNYLTHPAFTFGTNNELNGIWVGKFETTVNPTSSCGSCTDDADCLSKCQDISYSDVSILPNTKALRYQNVSSQFNTAKKFKDYGLSFDTHLIKNSEWGAVTYLSHSKFGSLNQVRINNNNGYITGCGGSVDDAPESSQCEISYGNSTSYPQSTTSNITGIFDMAGGCHERVMGNYKSTLANSGFTAMPNEKYFDLYNGDTYETACNGSPCLGHATNETVLWYYDTYSAATTAAPWPSRGGYYANTTAAGVFFISRGGGAGQSFNSFRLAIAN